MNNSHTKTFVKESTLPYTPQQVWNWHEQPHAFSRVMPPWENTFSDRRQHTFKDQDELSFYFHLGPLKIHWKAVYEDVIPGVQFCDRQIKGPFPYWKHTHLFDSLQNGASTRMKDSVNYRLPFDPLGSILGGSYAHKRLIRMFNYRHYLVAKEMKHHLKVTPLNIAVTGASGLLAKALIPMLSSRGHHVYEITRSQYLREDHIIHWDPVSKTIDIDKLSKMDAVVHLAGESITGYWTKEKKQRILKSRIDGTQFLVDSLRKCSPKPKSLICASAIGYYGHRANETLTETSPKGTGFLSDVCQAWEVESFKAEALGLRTVALRIGIVLTPKGTALSQILMPFQMGLGGRLGSGNQHMSWIDIEDLCELFYSSLINSQYSGPINAVSPGSVGNAAFTQILSKAIRRPALFHVPQFALQTFLGEMAQELLFADIRVTPQSALQNGFAFEFPTLEKSLAHLLGAQFDAHA